jgi:hypothetical protein
VRDRLVEQDDGPLRQQRPRQAEARTLTTGNAAAPDPEPSLQPVWEPSDPGPETRRLERSDQVRIVHVVSGKAEVLAQGGGENVRGVVHHRDPTARATESGSDSTSRLPNPSLPTR